MKKGQRPGRHTRKVRTKTGIRMVIVNRNLAKHKILKKDLDPKFRYGPKYKKLRLLKKYVDPKLRYGSKYKKLRLLKKYRKVRTSKRKRG